MYWAHSMAEPALWLVLWRRCAMWRRTMTALHYALWRRCTVVAPYYDGAALWRAALLRTLHYGGHVLWRRCTVVAPYYDGAALALLYRDAALWRRCTVAAVTMSAAV